MIIATAGHVDHGKTALVRALTGVDTDRLPEEKARGMSIDLGFAYRRLEDGTLIGFVDVPGHERFVRNMAAGVCGVDLALLVVAADDGVMPQTIEHVNILAAFGVARAMVALSKADRVPAERLEAVAAQVRALLAGTAMAGAPCFPTAAPTGAGLEPLLAELTRMSRACRRPASPEKHFRLAVDRAFSIAGSGTIVTGTVFDGVASVGDRLVISPSGREVRVRAIRVHDRAVDAIGAGQRCALNLVGIDAGEATRGDWVLAGEAHRPTSHVEAEIRLCEPGVRLSADGARVFAHLGAGVVGARLTIRRGAMPAPGSPGIARISFDRPVIAAHGDRFVLRDGGGARTMGGGRILDPFAARRGHGSEANQARLRALHVDTPAQALSALAACADGVIDLDWFRAAFCLRDAALEASLAATGLVCIGGAGRWGVTPERLGALRQAAQATLGRFHAAQPRRVGMERAALMHSAAPGFPASVFSDVLRAMLEEGRLVAHDGLLALAAHDPAANEADRRLWERVAPKLHRDGFAVPGVADLAARLGLPVAEVLDFLHRKAYSGAVVRVGASRFILRETLAHLADVAATLGTTMRDGTFTVAAFRDAAGIGRGLAIDILDRMDRLGLTAREGDVRRVRADHRPILGTGRPAPVVRRANWRRRHRFPTGSVTR